MGAGPLIWHANPDAVETTTRALADGGAEVRPAMAFDPPATVTAWAGTAALARAIATLHGDPAYGGTLVDLTSDPVVVREMPEWAEGQVLLIGARGPDVHGFASEGDLIARLTAARGR